MTNNADDNTTHHSLRQHIQSVYKLSRESLDLVCSIAQPLKLSKGEIVLQEGQVCRQIYYIEKGYLRFYYLQDGKEINTDFYFENSFATNLKSLRNAEPSPYAVVCAEPTSLYTFDKDALLKLYEIPEIVAFGKELMERILIDQQDHSTIFKLYSAEERYRFLEKHFPLFLQRISLSHLSSYLGTARETLSRIRAGKA